MTKPVASLDSPFDPYPDTGETGETYDEEMRSVIGETSERIAGALQFAVNIILSSGSGRERGQQSERGF